MNLTQVSGNTWVLDADQLIPVYKVDESHCILLDTGLLEERESIEAALEKAGLTPVGIIGSHVHIDHCGNSRYFQEKYHIPVALSIPEAAMCRSPIPLKCYFMTVPLEDVVEQNSYMVHEADLFLPAEDGPFDFLGCRFQIMHTPGHSAGHVCIKTPDDVFYLGDSLLSWDLLNAKLPYNLSHTLAIQSREKLRGLSCKAVILAHRDVCGPADLEGLIEGNNRLLYRRAQQVWELVNEPMTFSQINGALLQRYHLFTKDLRRAFRFERNIWMMVEFLVELGALEPFCRLGVALYRRVDDVIFP